MFPNSENDVIADPADGAGVITNQSIIKNLIDRDFIHLKLVGRVSIAAIAMSTSLKSYPSPNISHTGDDVPFARQWWFHSSSVPLDDPLASPSKASLDEGKWKPFSSRDCRALEVKWSQLPDEMKRKLEGIPDEESVVDELGTQTVKKEDESFNDVKQGVARVIVGVERLYHVDLLTQRRLALFRRLIIDLNLYIGFH